MSKTFQIAAKISLFRKSALNFFVRLVLNVFHGRLCNIFWSNTSTVNQNSEFNLEIVGEKQELRFLNFYLVLLHGKVDILTWLWQVEICKSNIFQGCFGILRLDIFRHYNQFLGNAYCAPSIGPDVNHPQFHMVFAQFCLIFA